MNATARTQHRIELTEDEVRQAISEFLFRQGQKTPPHGYGLVAFGHGYRFGGLEGIEISYSVEVKP